MRRLDVIWDRPARGRRKAIIKSLMTIWIFIQEDGFPKTAIVLSSCKRIMSLRKWLEKSEDIRVSFETLIQDAQWEYCDGFAFEGA